MGIAAATPRVDRGYHWSEAVRFYHDRRKMKWNPFATAELGAAHRLYRETADLDLPSEKLDNESKFEILTSAQYVQVGIELTIADEYEEISVMGYVSAFTDESHVVIEQLDKHYKELTIDEILDIQPLDDLMGLIERV
jgi:hypothetical protein